MNLYPVTRRMSAHEDDGASRREFLKASWSALASLPLVSCIARPLPVRMPYGSAIPVRETDTLVNDIHSQLNATRVSTIIKPANLGDIRALILEARATGTPVSIAGGRHAMGGQQFRTAGVLVDTRALNRVRTFDAENGTIECEGGIQWPELVSHIARAQEGLERQWGIYQKQTGADRLSLGGALACNAHGRGLTLKPIIQQVESFDLIDHLGEIRTCSRQENADLFRLAIGGYGLFGIVTAVRLKLRPRVKVRRIVELAEVADVADRFEDRIRDGYLYGDFQFATDTGRDSFLVKVCLPVTGPCRRTHRSRPTQRASTPRTGPASRSTRTGTSVGPSRCTRRGISTPRGRCIGPTTNWRRRTSMTTTPTSTGPSRRG